MRFGSDLKRFLCVLCAFDAFLTFLCVNSKFVCARVSCRRRFFFGGKGTFENFKLFAPEYLAAGVFFRPKRRLLNFWTCIYVFFDDFRCFFFTIYCDL